MKDDKQTVIVKLKPAGTVSGVVVTSEGLPVAGAGVALVDMDFGGRSVEFSKGRLKTSGSKSALVTTDASGRFEISSPPEVGMIVAAADIGFASASLTEVRSSGVLTLQPFGRIEGVLVGSAGSVEGQELMLGSSMSSLRFDHDGYRAKTDHEGRFVIEKVPPGTMSLGRMVKITLNSWTYSHRTEVIVRPGQTTQVTLGGTDATLQGSVRFEGEPPADEYMIHARLDTPMPTLPQGTPEERRAFMSTPEWQGMMKQRKSYAVSVGQDGSLLLDSIAPGEYQLKVTVAAAEGNSFIRKPLASGEAAVTVPVGASPGSPIDIGEIVLRTTQK